MKIASTEPIILKIPFTDGSAGKGLFPTTWNTLEFVLVKITTDNGLTGWGEGFSYHCSTAVASMIENNLAPLLVGKEISNPFEISEELQKKTVLPGRYGITTFAISGVDLAIWDLLAKEKKIPVYQLFGKKIRDKVKAYASLVRYGNSALVNEFATEAIQNGYSEIKLHEITLPEIESCRKVIGNDIEMTVDVNCNWSEELTRELIPSLKELNVKWLEEPNFPPEDFELLASLRKLGLSLAAGENACTAMQFKEMINKKALDYLQPSVTKVGGITECLKIQKMNEHAKVKTAPHSPYFGPGYLASLHLAAVDPFYTVFEYLYIKPDSWLYKDFPLPVKGEITIPETPGLGLDPDPEVLEKYSKNH